MTSGARSRETVDTSVLVPALLSWHPKHDLVRTRAKHVRVVPAHTILECFSVLTRLPSPDRLAPSAAADAVAAIDLEPLGLAPSDQREMINALATAGIGGGAVFDGLIGATARTHGLTVLTLDHRAAATYDAVGATFRLL